jgi:hypothetical protein
MARLNNDQSVHSLRRLTEDDEMLGSDVGSHRGWQTGGLVGSAE